MGNGFGYLCSDGNGQGDGIVINLCHFKSAPDKEKTQKIREKNEKSYQKTIEGKEIKKKQVREQH